MAYSNQFQDLRNKYQNEKGFDANSISNEDWDKMVSAGEVDDIGGGVWRLGGRGVAGIAGSGTPFGTVQRKSKAEQLADQQTSNAQSFGQALPGLKQQSAGLIRQQNNEQMGADLNQVKQTDSARGLLHGGIHQGNEGAVRAGAASNTSNQIQASNTSWDNQANQVATGALSSAAAIQQHQQTYMNQMYMRSQADQAAGDQAAWNMIGTIGTAAVMFSDERLKEDIQRVECAIEKIGRLNGVTWKWKDQFGGGRSLGVIAQDVEHVFPEAVLTIEDVKLVQYQLLIGPLIEAVKELTERVKTLEEVR